MLEVGAALPLDLGLDPSLQFSIAGESIALKSGIPGVLIKTILRMVCLDRCAEVGGIGLAGEENEDIPGLGRGKARVVNAAALLGLTFRLGEPGGLLDIPAT